MPTSRPGRERTSPDPACSSCANHGLAFRARSARGPGRFIRWGRPAGAILDWLTKRGPPRARASDRPGTADRCAAGQLIPPARPAGVEGAGNDRLSVSRLGDAASPTAADWGLDSSRRVVARGLPRLRRCGVLDRTAAPSTSRRPGELRGDAWSPQTATRSCPWRCLPCPPRRRRSRHGRSGSSRSRLEPGRGRALYDGV